MDTTIGIVLKSSSKICILQSDLYSIKNGGGASLTLGLEGGGVTIFPIAGVTGKGGAALGIAEGDGVIFTKDKLGKLRSFKQ